MCGWCLAYCTGVVLNAVGESAMPDSKENKQADAGSRRFRRHFLCGALLCNFLSTEHEGLSTHVQREWSAEPFMSSILSLRILIIEMQIQSSYCVCCVFFPFILDIKFVGRTSRGHTGGRSHRISHPPSFCGACLNFSREKDSAVQTFLEALIVTGRSPSCFGE